jgi:hypothetical protein
LLCGVTLKFISFLTGFNYFSVKKIDVDGSNFTDKSKILAYCNKFLNSNIFLIKFDEIDEFNNEWVKKIIFEKIYPDKIVVHVFERKPLLNIKEDNKCYFLTDDLKRISSNCENTNVIIKDNISDQVLLAFADIYNNFDSSFDYIELYSTFFKAHNQNSFMLGSYNNEFLDNYNIYQKKIVQLYRNIDHSDLRISGKIYVKGELNGS